MDLGVGGFSEEQFREACAELQQPALSGADWELLVETFGISIYRLLDQVAVGPLEDHGATAYGVPLTAGSAGLQPEVRTSRVFWSPEELALGVPPADFAPCWSRGVGRSSEFSLRSEARQGKSFVTTY